MWETLDFIRRLFCTGKFIIKSPYFLHDICGA